MPTAPAGAHALLGKPRRGIAFTVYMAAFSGACGDTSTGPEPSDEVILGPVTIVDVVGDKDGFPEPASDQVALELSALLTGADVAFLLHEDPRILDAVRLAIFRRLGI